MSKLMKTFAGTAWMVALLIPGVALAVPPAVQPPDFCKAFNDVSTNPTLLGQLDAELGTFVTLLQPDVLDINGSFNIDDSGDDLLILFEGNGILDGSNELKLIQRIYNGNGSKGVYTQAEVRAAYLKNWTELMVSIDDSPAGTLATLLNSLVPGILQMFTGYLTLGDGDYEIISKPSPETPDAKINIRGTGSFGFVGALFNVLDYYVGDLLPGESFSKPELDKTAMTQLPELLPNGDADGDGFSNLCEYRAFGPRPCSASSGDDYIAAALDPDITPDGCYEDVQTCLAELRPDNVVGGSTVDAGGNVSITTWQNDVTLEYRYRLRIFHYAPYAASYQISTGAPGENGTTIYSRNADDAKRLKQRSATYVEQTTYEELPLLDLEIPEGLAWQIASQPTYFSVFAYDAEAPSRELTTPTTSPPDIAEPATSAEGLRANLSCVVPSLPNDLKTCTNFELNAQNLVPVPVDPSTKVGAGALLYSASKKKLFGSFFQDLNTLSGSELRVGAPGANGVLLADLGLPTSKGATRIEIDLSDEQDLIVSAQPLYLLVTNPTFPEGAMRGDITCIPGSHSCDYNGDYLISLSELLAAIQIYNTRLVPANTTGEYFCSPEDGDDGYTSNPDLGSDQSCDPHSLDYKPQDWKVSLTELLRVIQFYNAGGYSECPAEGTEDGYCAGQL